MDTSLRGAAWVFSTPNGAFYIRQREGLFDLGFESDELRELLGSYSNPGGAAEDLAHDHVGRPSWVPDPKSLGVSEDLGEWERVR